MTYGNEIHFYVCVISFDINSRGSILPLEVLDNSRRWKSIFLSTPELPTKDNKNVSFLPLGK